MAEAGKTVKLYDGKEMPRLGLGTWKVGFVLDRNKYDLCIMLCIFLMNKQPFSCIHFDFLDRHQQRKRKLQ